MPLKKNFINRKKKVVLSSSSESESSSSEEDMEPSATSSSNVYESASESTEYTECSSSESESDKKKSSEKFKIQNFRKELANIFPSKYSKARAEEAAAASSASASPKRKKDKKSDKKVDKRKHKSRQESDESETLSDTDTWSAEDSEEEEVDHVREKGKFNIIVNIDNAGGGAEYDSEYSDVESLEEDVSEELNSDDEKTFMRETYESIERLSPKSNGDSKKKTSSKKSDVEVPPEFEQEYKETVDLKKMLTEQLKQRPNNKILKKSLEDCESSIRKLIRKARHNNTNAYYKLVNSEKKRTDEIDYFKHRLSNKEQKTIISDLDEINRHIYVEKPYRLALLQSKMPNKFKTVAMQRLNTLNSMDSTDNEYYKIKNWIDAFMRIPFGIYRSIHIKREDGLEVSNEFMQNAKQTLDNCVFGLNDAKMQIMQMLGQWIVNPNSMGTAIAIHGPPGTGKTSIVKDGISKILGREFAFIALGGCGDGSFLEGHSYTYEGSTWGRIVQILMDSKCMNPIIYFDELDKVSDTPRGQEIIGILTHLTDTSQNGEYHDKYFSEVSFDLSKCLFIFSYNDESLVNPILKDRMYRIQTKGYETVDKITIARNYLLPKIREQVNFTEEEVIIPDETLRYIVSTQHLTKGESGVRNLKRCLEVIYTKLNLYRLVKPDNPLFEKDLGVKVQFPITITRKEVDQFIKNNETINPSLLAMYT